MAKIINEWSSGDGDTESETKVVEVDGETFAVTLTHYRGLWYREDGTIPGPDDEKVLLTNVFARPVRYEPERKFPLRPRGTRRSVLDWTTNETPTWESVLAELETELRESDN